MREEVILARDLSIEELRNLYNEGILNKMFVSGYITVKPILQVEFLNYIEARKNIKKSHLVIELSVAYNLGVSTVWKYLKDINKPL